jgi:hypothetical protein
MRAKAACGHADWKRCVYCKQYSDPAEMGCNQNKENYFYHRACVVEYQRKRTQKAS